MHTNLRTFLKQLEEYGRAHDAQEPEHSRKMLNLEADTAELVSILAQSSGAQHALEIGTSNGYSTIWLAWAASTNGGISSASIAIHVSRRWPTRICGVWDCARWLNFNMAMQLKS